MKWSTAWVLLLFAATQYVSAQEEKAKEYFEEAAFFFYRKEYNEALYFYHKLLEIYPEQAHFNFKAGECYLHIPGREILAIPFLEKAIKSVVPKKKFRQQNMDEQHAPLHAYFYLGNAYRYNDEIDKALEVYNTFINAPYYSGNYNESIVENEITSCEQAKLIKDRPVKVTFEKLPVPINASPVNFNPAVAADATTMVYVNRQKFYDALFYTRKTEEGWSTPQNINPQVGSDGDFYPSCLSADGKELYLVKENKHSKDIYVSKFDGKQWSKAQRLTKSINSRKDETHASISANGNALYFTSNRGWGKKGTDIYVSYRGASGEWGKAQKLAEMINTPFNEETPFIMGNEEKLFFSSQGHFNMGGYDIFYSVKKNGNWSSPVNIGYPISNTKDNVFFVPVGDGNTGYYAKPATDGSGNTDIYFIRIESKYSD